MILNESLFEDVEMNEYLQYDNKRDEDEEEFFDDEFLFEGLHEGDYFEYGDLSFQLLYMDEDPRDNLEYAIACLEVEGATSDEDIIGFVEKGATREDVMKVIKDNYETFRRNVDIKESIKEDAEQPISPEDVTEKDLTSGDEIVEQNAYTNLLIDALNEEWATVQHYQEIINQLQEHDEYKDLIVVIEDIIKDEKNHVGNLQMIIDTISTKTLTDIADGEQEAIDQLEGKEDKGE